MSDHTEWGHASDALYTLHPRERAAEELRADNAHEITCPYVLGLWNQAGDGLALQGTRRELLTYLRLVIEHVERETDPRERARPGVAPAAHTARRAQHRTGGRRPQRRHTPRRARGQRPRRRRLRRRDRQRPAVNPRTGPGHPPPAGWPGPPFLPESPGAPGGAMATWRWPKSVAPHLL